MRAVLVLFGLLVAVGLRYLWTTVTSPAERSAILDDIGVSEVLQASQREYGSPQIIKVDEDVYVAVGYAFATVTMLVGDNGVIIVDTADNIDSARKIQEKFTEITNNKETKLIIYTHHHFDHVYGAKAFVTPGAPPPEVWAHERVLKEQSLMLPVMDIYGKRAAFQFGAVLADKYKYKLSHDSWSLNKLFNGGTNLLGKLPPTKLVKGDFNATVAGVDFSVIYIPGETSDQIGVWLPRSRILIAADDFYKSFPNLYAIRGCTPRDVTDWIRSLDKMIRLRPRCLVSGHYKPICGENDVHAILTDYKKAIQYVHDQTVRYINKGMHPDQIAKTVRLPAEFRNNPYLWQVYGTVPWSTKGIFDMYMGWFSGSAQELNPLAPTERAQRLIELIGKDRMLSAAEEALSARDYQWALELASHVFTVDGTNEKALAVRRAALKRLASLSSSSNGRHYLMSAIVVDAGYPTGSIANNFYRTLPVHASLGRLRYRVRAEAIPNGVDITGCFRITDALLTTCLRLCKRVIDLAAPSEIKSPHFSVSLNESTFRALMDNMAQLSSSGSNLATDGMLIEGDPDKFQLFLSYLDME